MEAKNQTRIRPNNLWTKAHKNDIGILNIIKQRLKEIEIKRWLSDVNNDVRKDAANQKSKLRDGPLEKLWGGGGRGIFELQEFFFFNFSRE